VEPAAPYMQDATDWGDIYLVQVSTASDSQHPWPTSNQKGAGWNYRDSDENDHLYFSCNNGDGVFEIELSTLDLERLTATAIWKSQSDPTGSNDGMNCLLSDVPCGMEGTGLMSELTGTVYEFTTKDSTNPHITAFDPTNQETSVPTTSGVVITMNEDITGTVGEIVTLYSYTVTGDYITLDETDQGGQRDVIIQSSMAP